jgi:hypothetical protein
MQGGTGRAADTVAGMTDQPQAVSPAERTCGRTLALSALRPGWTPLEHRGELVWACPDCCRRLARWGW